MAPRQSTRSVVANNKNRISEDQDLILTTKVLFQTVDTPGVSVSKVTKNKQKHLDFHSTKKVHQNN